MPVCPFCGYGYFPDIESPVCPVCGKDPAFAELPLSEKDGEP